MTRTHELSNDARVLIMAWFWHGVKTRVNIGGKDAENVLSDRAEAAMRELIDKGYVTAEKFNERGRMTYIGTAKANDSSVRLSLKDLDKYGAWSATMPNPARKSA